MKGLQLILATGNEGKVRELREILAGSGLEFVSARELGLRLEAPEDADTLEGNAYIKAREVFEKTGSASLSDDSGLFVDALEGEPGVHAARYAGEGCTPDDNIDKMLTALESVPDTQRTARFCCCICVILPDGTPEGRVLFATGKLEGSIARSCSGTEGFGYDPIFLLPDGRSLAQLDAAEKNRISHRANAAAAMRQRLETELRK